MTTAITAETPPAADKTQPIVTPLSVRLVGFREVIHNGNINWGKSWPMMHGKFPKTHPVGGGFCDEDDGQCGSSEAMRAFRERGYWASCFPEGDGITWRPLNGQTLQQTATDVRECFGWNVSV